MATSEKSSPSQKLEKKKSVVSLKENSTSLPEPSYLPKPSHEEKTEQGDVAGFSAPYPDGIVELKRSELVVEENPYEALADRPVPSKAERQDDLLNYVATASALSSFARAPSAGGRSSGSSNQPTGSQSTTSNPNTPNSTSSNNPRPNNTGSNNSSSTPTEGSDLPRGSDSAASGGDGSENPYLQLIEQRANLTDEEREEAEASRGSNMDAYLQAVKSLK